VLVLRRNCGQSIVIGKDAEIIIKILRDEQGVISVGIKAPQSVPVDRFEVYEKRQKIIPPVDDVVNSKHLYQK
jgi:carbon storage regulator